MLFETTTFIGVDPAGGRKPFTYAALDGDRKLLALGDGEIEEVLAFLGGQRSAFVAVNAPSQTNKGLMKQEEVKRSLAPLHQPGRSAEMRLSEHVLREHGIVVGNTPSRVDLAPTWVQMGFSFYQRLKTLGYTCYPEGSEATHQWMETHPHAIFCVLLGQTPLQKHSLEGRLQRQLILHEQGLGILDPMDFFEEVTRHRLLKGSLPLENLYQAGELDALAAAFTAYTAARHPNQISMVGAQEEGRIIIPVPELKQKY
jgi:hypothetical protein